MDQASPKTGAELEKFLATGNWMRNSIFEYANLTEHLQSLLKSAQITMNSAISSKLSGLKFQNEEWTPVEE